MSKDQTFAESLIKSYLMKKQAQRRISSIEKENYNRKNISMVENVYISELAQMHATIPSVVITGANNEYRTEYIINRSIVAYNSQKPIIILHHGNRKLISRMKSTFKDNSYFICIEGIDSIYDPIKGLSEEDFVLFMQKISDKDNMTIGFENIIRGIYRYCKFVLKRELDFEFLSRCPVMQLKDKLDQRFFNGTISKKIFDDVSSCLFEGENQEGNVSIFIRTVYHAFRNVIWVNKSVEPCSFLNTIQKQSVMLFDISNIDMETLQRCFIAELSLCNLPLNELCVVLDDIELGINKDFDSLMIQRVGNNHVVFSYTDISSAIGNKNQLEILLQKNNCFLIFKQNSAITSAYLSQCLGDYEKIEYSQQLSNNNRFGVIVNYFDGFADNVSLSLSNKKERRISPEDLLNLSNNECFYLQYGDSVIYRLFFV